MCSTVTLPFVQNHFKLREKTKFDFTIEEGYGRLNPSSGKKLTQAPQENGEEKNTPIKKTPPPGCDPG